MGRKIRLPIDPEDCHDAVWCHRLPGTKHGFVLDGMTAGSPERPAIGMYWLQDRQRQRLSDFFWFSIRFWAILPFAHMRACPTVAYSWLPKHKQLCRRCLPEIYWRCKVKTYTMCFSKKNSSHFQGRGADLYSAFWRSRLCDFVHMPRRWQVWSSWSCSKLAW